MTLYEMLFLYERKLVHSILHQIYFLHHPCFQKHEVLKDVSKEYDEYDSNTGSNYMSHGTAIFRKILDRIPAPNLIALGFFAPPTLIQHIVIFFGACVELWQNLFELVPLPELSWNSFWHFVEQFLLLQILSNIPMRLYILDDQTNSAIRSWLLGFTFHHQHTFPPFHKVRALFVAIKGLTLAQVCFNFRKYLHLWRPDRHPRCTCAAFPMSIQMKKRSTERISCFASDISDVPLFAAHMEDELCPSRSSFLAHNTQAFEKFLHQ